MKVISMLPPLAVNTGGREVPLNVPNRGEEVVDPLYTLTKSYPDSVLNAVNVRVMDPPSIGCISLLHDMLLK